jgi:xanthine dehydrogenase accessory factor
MKKLFSNIYAKVKKGEDIVLVSIIADSGSTPRGAGAKMAIYKDGTSVGTIGGGAVEYRSAQLALEALKEKKSSTKGFRLAPNDVADLGMICGGDVVVYFQYIEANNENIALIENINMHLNKDEDSWLITEISDEAGLNMRIHSKSCCGLAEKNNTKYFIEPLSTIGKVCIYGGGHISQKLVPVLHSIDFKCVVIDDKVEFANPELFPLAVKTVVADFAEFSNQIKINPCDYVVILTRGHQHDYDVLAQALRTEACYIGMIGSRTKLGKTKERLFKDGFSEDDFNRVYAPIGTAIKAVTPEEIAISIAGEMIRVRAELKNADKNISVLDSLSFHKHNEIMVG